VLPEGHTNISSFYHDGPGTDAFDRNSLNHVLYHEVQDALYRLGHQDMHRFTIALSTGGGGNIWTTNGQPWVFSTQRAISPARPQ